MHDPLLPMSQLIDVSRKWSSRINKLPISCVTDMITCVMISLHSEDE